ncbi:MAG: FecR domain-containing protein [Deltaproteobacteria bacterium]|nr:FecR domain-containing protein [Deltaproteobacteria bacterium]
MLQTKRLTWLVLLAATISLLACGKKGSTKSKESSDKTAAKASSDKGKDVAHKPGDARKAPETRAARKTVAEAVLGDVSGTVLVRPTGAADFAPAKAGRPFNAGDTIRVGGDGKATVNLWDHTSIDLAPASALRIEGTDSITDPSPGVTVLSGAVHFDVVKRKAGQGPLMVYAPTFVTAVVGTSLDVGVALSGEGRIGVEDGTVQVTGTGSLNAPVKVAKGHVVVVSDAGRPGRMQAYDPQKDDWDAWLAARDKRVAARAEQIARKHAAAIRRLAKLQKKLAQATKRAMENAEQAAAKADAAAKGGKKAVYIKLQPGVEADLDGADAMVEQVRTVDARVAARAYLLSLLAARAAAGQYKISVPKLKKIHADLASLDAIVPAAEDWYPQWRGRWLHRRPRFRRYYYYHHHRGRRLAPIVGVAVPPVYVDLKIPKPVRPVPIRVAGWHHPLLRRPWVAVKIRPGMRVDLRPVGWYRRPGWRGPANPAFARRRLRWRHRVSDRRMKRWHGRPHFRVGWRRRRGRIHGRGIRVRGPNMHLRTPGIRVRTPGLRIRTPGVRVHAPGVRVRGPRVRVRVPGVRVHAPGVRVRGPGLRVRGGGSVRIGRRGRGMHGRRRLRGRKGHDRRGHRR